MNNDNNDGFSEFMQKARLKAGSRETFDFPLTAEDTPRSEHLAKGPALPGIVGIPTTAALSGTHQYLGFAKVFRNRRDVFALTVPGFVAGDRLPASIEAAIEVEVNAIRSCVNDAPVVLVGISSGGTFAYGIASHLEGQGLPVAAVVLIDAYPFRTAIAHDDLAYGMLRRMFEEKELRRYLTDTRLTAMAWYAKLFMDWELAEVVAPTLLVRPEEPMPGMSTDKEWRSEWTHPHDMIEVPGNHWTMTMEDAASTAEAVEAWLVDAVRA